MKNISRLVYSVVTLLLLTLAINGDSLWIDEITTAWLSSATSFIDLIARIRSTGSEAQMPMFVVYMWGWVRMFGTSEWYLRASNIPWIIIGILSLARLLRNYNCREACLLLCLWPVLTYHMNEARPYIMTFSSAALTWVALDQLIIKPSTNRGWWRMAFLAGFGACIGASMLNLFVVPALIVYVIMRSRLLYSEEKSAIQTLWQNNRSVFLGAGAILMVFVVYYIWTLKNGYGGQKTSFSITNLCFACYEWSGFSGIGPPREIMRNLSFGEIAYGWRYVLLFFSLCWGYVFFVWIFEARKIMRLTFVPLTSFVTGNFLLLIAAVLAPASLWGRHFVFTGPMFILLLAIVLGRIGVNRRSFITLILVVLMFSVSSARLRFDKQYKKDDYRHAVEVISSFKNEASEFISLAWVGYDRAYSHYSNKTLGADTAAPDVVANNWTVSQVEEWLARHPHCLLLLHRPDKWDNTGAWGRVSDLSGRVIWKEGSMAVYEIKQRRK
ncbi:hypothetical protein ACFLS1_02505 [Verrucomicrobiota bacterium]